MNKEQINRIVREVDGNLPVPSSPQDDNVPVRFGKMGAVVIGESGVPFLINVYNNMGELHACESLPVWGKGYGHVVLVGYGAVIVEDDVATVQPTRIMFGMTHDSMSILIRTLDDDSVEVINPDDEDIENHEMSDLRQRVFG